VAYLNVSEDQSIYYEYHRGTGLPVVLIHGWGMNCRVWDTTLVALQAAGHAVISFDQRGCGRSDKDFSEVSIESSAADAIALLQALGVDRAAFNGWSLGGSIAVEAARRAGTACAGLVLTAAASPRYVQCDDFAFGNPPGSTAETLKLLQADRAGFLFELTKAVFAKPQSDAVIHWAWSIFMQNAPTADRALAQLDSVDQRDILAALDIPVLSMVGGLDVVVDPAICREAARIARHGRVEEFADCGHAPFLEDGEHYRQALLDFLKPLN